MSAPYVTVTRKEKFSAAHRLHSLQLSDVENVQLYGKCNNVNGHGHNYTVEVSCRGPVDQRTGMVINLSDLKRVIKKVIEPLDHANLDKDIEFFKHNVSTTENVAVYIFDQVQKLLEPKSLLHSVTVHETDNQYFTIYSDTSGK